jgi:hypothetical protein
LTAWTVPLTIAKLAKMVPLGFALASDALLDHLACSLGASTPKLQGVVSL